MVWIWCVVEVVVVGEDGASDGCSKGVRMGITGGDEGEGRGEGKVRVGLSMRVSVKG